MTKQIGIWIDHRKAVLFTLTDREETLNVIESDIDRHASIRGAIRSRMPYNAQYPEGDDHLDKKYEEQLKKYYEKVLAYLRSADTVWIFGPGEAKDELKKRLALHKNHTVIDGVETADKMTDRQIAARVRNHFQTATARA